MTEPNNCEENKLKKKQQEKEIYRQLHISSVGVLINVSSYYGLINLQSSLNIRDALGTIGLTIGYIASVFWALLLSPIAIDHLGPKLSLVISEATYIAYCAANFYPGLLTLIPGSIILGFGEACCWASMSVIVTYYGEQYWLIQNQSSMIKESESTTCQQINSVAPATNSSRRSLSRTGISETCFTSSDAGNGEMKSHDKPATKDATVSFFFGRYFTIVKGGSFIGNLLSYVALYGAKIITEESKIENTGNLNASAVLRFGNVSSASPFNDSSPENGSKLDLSLCGIKDCTVTLKEMSDFKLQRYTPDSELSVNILLGVFLLMHFVAIIMHYFLLDDMELKGQIGRDKSKLSFSTEKLKCLERWWIKISSSLTTTFRQMASLQQILASPIALYFGLFLSYCLSEFTRAFISCPMGIENVGLLMMLFGASSMMSALILGKFIPKFGRNPLYLLAFLIDVGTYASNLFWKPSTESFYAVYIMAVAFGFNAGLWEPLINSTYAHYFAHNTSAAFSLWNFWGAMGLFTGFALSTTVCLAVKLYVLLSLLCFSMACYVIAEIRFKSIKLQFL